MRVEDLRLLGGRLCIDFVNSVENRDGDEPLELLTSYPALVRWGRHAGLLDDADLARLTAAAAAHEAAAEHVLEEALEFREVLHRILRAVAERETPASENLERLQQAYGRAVAGGALQPEGDGFGWSLRAEPAALDQVLWPVAFSAVGLLTEGELRRVKLCANPHGCGWLFYDGSKNASRRWCSMEGCGSQVKMRRHYARQKRKQAAESGVRSE